MVMWVIDAGDDSMLYDFWISDGAMQYISGSSSVGERLVPNQKVTGSIPVCRSKGDEDEQG